MGLCNLGYKLEEAHRASHLRSAAEEALAHEQYSHHLRTCPFCRRYLDEGYQQAKVAVHPPLEESEA